MKLEASITGKRQVTIPKDVYAEMSLNNSDKIVFSKNDKGEIVISKKEIDSLDACPICNRIVKNEDVMVVKDSQKHHLACWNIDENDNKKGSDNYISNKVTETQKQSLSRIIEAVNEAKIEDIKSLKDNEVIIDVPVKLVFMENKPGAIGMVSNFDSNKIFACNRF